MNTSVPPSKPKPKLKKKLKKYIKTLRITKRSNASKLIPNVLITEPADVVLNVEKKFSDACFKKKRKLLRRFNSLIKRHVFLLMFFRLSRWCNSKKNLKNIRVTRRVYRVIFIKRGLKKKVRSTRLVSISLLRLLRRSRKL
jgi:hypothetical protein